MAGIIPRVITPTAASGATVLDGSLRFGGISSYLKRPFHNGNKRIFTISAWVKRNKLYDSVGASNFKATLLNTTYGGKFARLTFYQNKLDMLSYNGSSYHFALSTLYEFRDTAAWYHIVAAVDTTHVDQSDRVKFYVNGKRIAPGSMSGTWPALNVETIFNSSEESNENRIGWDEGNSTFSDMLLSDYYFIDGQALDESYFGYTDPLTNTWRPKKFSGYYNVVPSVATGAKPILNTTGDTGSQTDGTVDTSDPAKASLKIALPLQDDTNDVSNIVRGSGSAVSVTAINSKYSSGAYSRYYNAAGDFVTDTTNYFGMEVSNSNGHFDIGTGDCCIEWWAYYPATPSSNGYIFRTGTAGAYTCYAYRHDTGDVSIKFGSFTWTAYPDNGSGVADDFDNNVWNHFCIERNGGDTWTAYMNGVPLRTITDNVDISPGDTIGIGNYDATNLPQNLIYRAQCYLQDFRWYNASKYGGKAFNVPARGFNSSYLPLDENTVVGKDESGIEADINDGNDWSAYVDGLAPTAGYGKDKMFNGSIHGSYLAGTGAVTVTFPGGGLDFSNRLRIMAQVTSGTKDIVFNWNGGSYTLEVGAVGAVWWDVTENVTSPITSIQWTSDGNDPYVNALEVDNVIMNKCVEGHSWTPEFLVGSNVIPKAEGAFPILNTVDGGKVATAGVRKEVGPNTPQIVKDSGCVSFDGEQDYITVNNSASSSDYDFGSGEFTMECWFNSKVSDSSNHYSLIYKSVSQSGADANSSFYLSLTDKVNFYFYYNNTLTKNILSSQFIAGTWNHCAVVRDSNTLRMYINGTQVGTEDLSGPLVMNTSNSTDVVIGSEATAGLTGLKGFLSNVRIVKESCLYPNGTTFTPSTEPLTNVTNTKLLCCQSPTSQIEAAVGSLNAAGGVYATDNELTGSCVLALPLLGERFDVSHKINSGSTEKTVAKHGSADKSNAQSNFYGGSFYFDGTTDYLLVTTRDDLSGFYDFTIEMWVFFTEFQSTEVLISKGYSGSEFPPYMIRNSNAHDILEFYASSNGTSFDVADAVPFGPSQGLLNNQWHHIAVTRQGSSGRLFLNGILKSEFISNTQLDANNNDVTIFSRDSGVAAPIGYAQDVRIYNGVAKYTKNFIPASTDPDITSDTPSGVALGSQVTKVTDNYGSMAFGGRESFLSIGDGINDDLAPGTGNFTLEFFVYIGDVISSGPGIMCWSPNSLPQGVSYDEGGAIAFTADGNYLDINLGYVGGSTGFSTPGGSVRQYTWHHIALVRDNDFIRVFVDGDRVYNNNAWGAPQLPNITNKYMIIGKYWTSDQFVLNGNISNFRFIKGTALYEDTFTPPTEPLTNVTNTKLLCCQSPLEQKNNFVKMYKSLGWENGNVVQADPYDNLSDILNKATEVNDREYVGTAGISSSWVYLVPSITGISTVRFDTNVGVGSTSVWNQNSSNMTNPGPSFSFYWRDGNSWTQTSGTYGLTSEWTKFNYGHDDTVNYTINMDREFYVLGSDTQNGYGGGPNPKLISGEVPYRDKYYSYKCEVSPYSSSWGGNMELMVSSQSDEPPGISTLSTASHFNPFTSDNINTVMGQETEYCTWNPACISGITTNILSNGNLTATHALNSGWSGNPGGTGYSQFVGNMGLESGKWYFETVWDFDLQGTNSDVGAVGICNHAMGSIYYPGHVGGYYSAGYAAGFYKTVNIHPHESWGYTVNWMPEAMIHDIIGVAIDMDDGKLYFSLNGAFINHARPEEGIGYVAENLNSGIGTHDRCVYPVIAQMSNSHKIVNTTNFGQKPFKYQPPEGFQPLSFANLPTPIVRPDQYVDTLYFNAPPQGTPEPTKITGLNFQADLLWGKSTTESYANQIVDSVRGGAYVLITETGAAQGDYSSNPPIYSFDSDGFTASTNFNVIYNTGTNPSGVVWGWKAGGYGQPIPDLVFGVNTEDDGFNSGTTARNYDTTSFSFVSYTTPQDSPGGTHDANSAQVYKSSSGKVVKWTVSTSGNNNDMYIWTSSDGINWVSKSTKYDTDAAPQQVTSKWIALSGGTNGETVTVKGYFAFNIDDVGYASAFEAGLSGSNLTVTSASVGTKQGFSIIKYQGNGAGTEQKIAHGLTKRPDFIIVKNMDSPIDWMIQHRCAGEGVTVGAGSTYYGILNNVNASGSPGFVNDAPVWGSSEPTGEEGAPHHPASTKSVFYVQEWNNINYTNGTDEFIAYLWHDVPGLQKFGRYTSNGDSNPDNGPFVYLGFRPAIVILKRAAGNAAQFPGYSDWFIYDNKRDPHNPVSDTLYPNHANVSSGGQARLDFLSNGFKFRSGVTVPNGEAGDTWIYAAWAEQPMNNLYGAQSNAR